MIEKGVVYAYLPTYRTIVLVEFLIKFQNSLKKSMKQIKEFLIVPHAVC